MNHKEKLALIKQRERVINDLDPKYTLDYLLSKGILDVRSDQLVRAQSTPSLRAAKLLDILPNCNGNAFKIFIDSLNNKKNYPWLANSLNDELNRQDSVSENKNVPIGMLLRGGVPRLGDYHINRPKEVDEVKKKLKNQFLQRGWVILHGMMGCGKSTVAAAAISDDQELISEYFTSGVFWVSCRAIDEGSLLTKMKALCEKLDKSYRNVSFDNIVVATERLRELFSRPEYFDVLLILDDVWTKLVVDSFNVGCNTLVTTTDSDLFGNVALKQEVNISSGFTEAQSLELLSKHAGVKVGDLPATAKNIHNISKGVPVLISAVGGYISNFPHDPAKWAICVKKLTGKTDGTRESNLRETIHGMLDLNLSVLKDELISYYYTLAVFREDVYVPREVLITFWDRNNIDEIMITFVKKSLVIRSWDDEGRTYLYIVHNLLLEYLKQKNTSNIAKFHKQLIERYQEKCDGKWHLLGDDSYIFESIGYHLHMAGLKDIMKEIYFDFKFIKAKIDNTMGCANLLYDYQKYFKDLTEPDFTKKLRDFIHFIRVNSDLLSDKNFDCLQLALCQPETSEVYKQARQMIPSCNQNAFYFDWCNKDNNKGACVSSCNIHKAAVRSAIFTPTGCRVISCDDDGMIRIWDSNSVKELCEIQGHNSRIRCCSFCVELKILVTCSADKTIKLWSVPANFFEEQNGNSDDSNDSPPTPITTKRCSNPHWKTEKYDDSKNYYILEFSDSNHSPHCCAISNDGTDVVSGGNDGLIFVWSVQQGTLRLKLTGHKDVVTCCQYSPIEPILATGSCDGTIILRNTSDYSIIKILQGIDKPISSCCFLPKGTKIAAAAQYNVLAWDIESEIMEQLFCDCTQCQILTIAASDRYVAVGTAGCSIIVYSLADKAVVNFHKGHKDWVRCVAFSGSGERFLSTSEDNCIKVWETCSTASSDLKMGDDCDASFTDDGVTIALVDLNNRVEVIQNNVKSQTIESNDKTVCIKCCAVSSQSMLIAVCRDDGLVKVFSLKDVPDPVSEWKVHSDSIECCEFSGNDSFLVTGSADCCVGIVALEKQSVAQRLVSHLERVTQVKLFQSDERIVSSSYDKTLVVWNIRTHSEVFKCVGHNDAVVFCDVSSDDTMIISASTDKTAKLWDAAHGNILATYSHGSCVRSCRFLPNCSQVVTGDDSGNLTIWKVNEDYSALQLMKCDCKVADLIVSQDSKYLISASKNLRWWDVQNGVCLQTFHTKGTNIRKLKVSPDFSTVICLDDAKEFYHLNAIQNPSNP